MLDVKALWIGDMLRIRSSGRVGRFAGINAEGKARIECDGKIYLAVPGNLELYREEVDDYKKIDEWLGLKSKQIPKKKTEPAPIEIDLHIEVLAPHLQQELPAMILSHQMGRCKVFVEESINRKLNRIKIVHGKGEGVLKAEVLHLIKQYREVSLTFEANDGGAVEVWFQYV
jgi:dsDNA-specific endonuclease/ATPase MutS2